MIDRKTFMPIKFQKPQLHWQPYRIACLVGNRISQQVLAKELEGIIAHIERSGRKLRYSQFIDARLLFETSEWILKSRDSQHEYEQKYGIFDPTDRESWKYNFAHAEIIGFIERWLAGAHEDGKAYLHKFASNCDGELFARVGKVTALEFTEIPLDVLESFIVEDIYAGTLLNSKTGERLFAAHIDFTNADGTRPDSEGQTAGISKKKGRRPLQREDAMEAISVLGYDRELPKNSTVESVLNEVNKWLDENGKNKVSKDTVRRAFEEIANSRYASPKTTRLHINSDRACVSGDQVPDRQVRSETTVHGAVA